MKEDFKNISIGKAKDIILESIIRKENNLKQTKEFQKELFVNASLDDVNFLLKSIIDSKLDLIKVYFGNETYITAIGHINPFLKNGGFEKIEVEEKWKKQKEYIDFKTSNLKLKTFFPLLGITLITFLFSTFNFIKNQSTSENTIQQEQRIEKMEAELTKLRILLLNQKQVLPSTNSKALNTKNDIKLVEDKTQ